MSDFDILSIKDGEKNQAVIDLLGLLENRDTEIEKRDAEIKKRDVEIEKLKAELARLKNQPEKPKLKPSVIGKKDKSIQHKSKKRSVNSSEKGTNKKKADVHKTIRLKPENIPEGSKLIKLRPYFVQNIIIKAENIKYLLEVWKTPDGKHLRANLPDSVKGRHYGNELRAYVLSLYYGAHVSQGEISALLSNMGIYISSGQISSILTDGHDGFHQEATDILETGLRYSKSVSTDDTGLRHEGKNGYCTHIGNEHFACYRSTEHKNRLEFLNFLQGNHAGYCINDHSLEYLKNIKFPAKKIRLLKRIAGKKFSDEVEWLAYLKKFGITGDNHIRGSTEAAMIGWTTTYYQKEIFIVSDGAPQFKILRHASCWVHTERKISSLIPGTDKEVQLQNKALDHFWQFYRVLRLYQMSSKYRRKSELRALFDKLFTQKTKWSDLDEALEVIHKNAKGLLMVLDYPFIPLHTNTSENDIREVVKKRNISGGTRSDLGRKCRDTFMSLKKTCRKLDISFWDLLNDRICEKGHIQPLSDILLSHIQAQAA